jgi:hypothetical protein
MKAKQILKEYLRFQNKHRNHKKKTFGNFRKVKVKESRMNLDSSIMKSNYYVLNLGDIDHMSMSKIKSAFVESSPVNRSKQPKVLYESKKTGDFNTLSNNHFESAHQNPPKSNFRKQSNQFADER